MALKTTLEELQNLYKTMSGKESKADNIADCISEIKSAYTSGGGGGVTIVSGQLNVDSSSAIKNASLALSDGSIINMALTSIDALTLTSKAGSTEGTVKITVKESLTSGNHYKYGVDITPSKPAKGESVASLSDWNGSDDIAAATDSVVTIVEVDANNLAVKAGTVSA